MNRNNDYGNESASSSSNFNSKHDDWRSRLDDDSFEYMWRDFFEKYGKKTRNIAAGVGLGILALTSVYTIPKDSVGIVKTFGDYSKTTKPGLHIKIPVAQSLTKVKNQAIFTEAFGFRTAKPGVKSEYVGTEEINAGGVSDGSLADIVEGEGLSTDGDLKQKALDVLKGEYLMLSGDLNMADVEWIVQYKISDPVAYSFNIKNPQKTLRDVSEAVTRVIVGDASIDEILTTGRNDIETSVKQKLQEKLRMYNTGLEIVLVQLQSSNPPESVRPSFNEVNKAGQEKEMKINNAREEYNKEIPKARGTALATVQEAEGYASQRVNNAMGDVARFKQIYVQYKNAPSVTRTRMYLEAMPSVLNSAKSIYYIEDNGLLLQKLDLNTLGGGSK